MFKSLHHVPLPMLDRAMSEVRRVLRPGGLAYISEPVFAGEMNEITRIFHDEEHVRREAFAAICRAVESGIFDLIDERFFFSPVCFADLAEFERRTIGVTHSNHQLTDSQLQQVRERFLTHLKAGGARFLAPMRVDLLQRE